MKTAVDCVQLDGNGIVGDGHAGPWHRRITLLSQEDSATLANKNGRQVSVGEFAENITTKGIELYKTKPFDRFKIGELELEVTQIGKKCHGDSCTIFREIGNCVMPKEGIFCRVIKPGKIVPGNIMFYYPKVFNILVITLSDRASKGEYKDKSVFEAQL